MTFSVRQCISMMDSSTFGVELVLASRGKRNSRRKLTLPGGLLGKLHLSLKVKVIGVLHDADVIQGCHRWHNGDVTLVLLGKNHPTPVKSPLEEGWEDSNLHELGKSMGELRGNKVAESFRKGPTGDYQSTNKR